MIRKCRCLTFSWPDGTCPYRCLRHRSDGHQCARLCTSLPQHHFTRVSQQQGLCVTPFRRPGKSHSTRPLWVTPVTQILTPEPHPLPEEPRVWHIAGAQELITVTVLRDLPFACLGSRTSEGRSPVATPVRTHRVACCRPGTWSCVLIHSIFQATL